MRVIFLSGQRGPSGRGWWWWRWAHNGRSWARYTAAASATVDPTVAASTVTATILGGGGVPPSAVADLEGLAMPHAVR